MTEIEELRARLAALEAKVNPEPKAPFVPKPYQQRDPTEGASSVVTPWMREMAQAVPTSLVRDIVNDFRGGPAQLRPLAPQNEEPPPTVATTVPIGPQRDIAAIDAIAKGFADRERAEELAKLVDVAAKLKDVGR
jgi:hypothetical protein